MNETENPKPSLSVPTRPRPRRWRRRILLALLFLVFAGVAGFLLYQWYAASALEEMMAELDRTDPGWRIAELEAKRKTLPADRNSALHLLAVKKLLGGQSVYTPAMDTLFENLQPQLQLSQQQSEYLDQRFEILRPGVLEARKLKDMPEGRFPLTISDDFFSTGPLHSMDAREIFTLLQWDAARRGQAGDAGGALESCQALLNAVRSIGDEPFLISLLVCYAGDAICVGALERTLAQGELTDAFESSLKDLQKELEKELLEKGLLTAMRGERAGIHHFFQNIREGKVNGNNIGVILGNGGIADLLGQLPGFYTSQQGAILRFYTEWIETLKLSDKEKSVRFQEFEANAKEQPLLVRNIVPALHKMWEAERRTQATLRCAVAGLAAERFRIAKDRWPVSLEELVQHGYLAAVPEDPFDFKPLRCKRTEEGLTIYSVGKDLKDDGGHIDPDRIGQTGTDLGFRLWDISRRRQPYTMIERP